MKTGTPLLTVSLICAALIGIAVFRLSTQESENLKAAATPAASKASSTFQLPTTETAAIAASAAAGPIASGARLESKLLLSELSSSTNYKKLYEDGKSDPSRGGLYIAGLIHQRCNEVRSIKSTGVELLPNAAHATAYKIQASRDRLNMLCEGMIEEDIDVQGGYAALYKHPNRQSDPLVKLKDSYGKAFAVSDTAGMSSGLAETLKLSSPELFLSLNLPMKDGEIYFDGQTYPLGETGAKILDAAKLLAVCDAWGRCGTSTDYYLLRTCAADGICESNYADLVAAQLPPEELSKARSIAKVMSKAITNQDLRPFIPMSSQRG